MRAEDIIQPVIGIANSSTIEPDVREVRQEALVGLESARQSRHGVEQPPQQAQRGEHQDRDADRLVPRDQLDLLAAERQVVRDA